MYNKYIKYSQSERNEITLNESNSIVDWIGLKIQHFKLLIPRQLTQLFL